MLIHYKKIIDNELKLFNQDLPSLSIYEPIKYIINLGGKRFRPSLTLLAADIFCEKPQLAINEAVAIELFHNFTLIHDDIMDEAPLRRNQQTVHNKWNINDAILSFVNRVIEQIKIKYKNKYKKFLFKNVKNIKEIKKNLEI